MNTETSQLKQDAYLYTEQITKSFKVGSGEVAVLKGINISIKKGEFAVIFGPSGCGKSTLLHTILGLEVPSSGRVVIDGTDFYTLSEDKRAMLRRHKVGMIYQQPLWISSYNVIENVTFPLHLLGMSEEDTMDRAMKNLTMVGLDKWATYRPTELSSGQQQKISLARALMTEPQLIVADEPTGNLDTVSGQELIQTFLNLVDQNKTIVMVTHDLEYLKYANRIFHIVDGVVVEELTSSKKKTIDSKGNDIAGKKEVGGSDSNVRDPNFLKSLHLD